MFRSMLSRSTNGINNTSTTDRQNSISNEFKSIKKAISVIFHKDNSITQHTPNDTEMLEFIPNDTSNISAEFPNIQEKLSDWKMKFRCHLESNENESEKNTGYLMISNPESDPVLISDQQAIRNAQPYVQINNTSFDIEKSQYSFITPCVSTNDDYSTRNFEANETRSNTECGVPEDNLADLHLSAHFSQVSSLISTNSSEHEYTNIDRSQLNDEEYLRAQEMDLHRLYNLEIDLTKQLNDLEIDIEYELQMAKEFESVVELNTELQKELRRLQENDPNRSPWRCNKCTFDNKPFEDTKQNVCEMCEGPSPMKDASLMR